MGKSDQLHKEGYELYRQSKYREAALTFLQASELSRELRDTRGWYKHRVWAAESFNQADDYVKSMDLLLEVRMHEPDDRPDFEAWISRKKLLVIMLATNPSAQKLYELLAELKTMASEQQVPAADILHIEGDIYEVKGKYLEALDAYAEGWHKNDNFGYMKSGYAINAATIHLKLGQYSKVADWLSASRETEKNYIERLLNEKQIELELSLAQQESPHILMQKLREIEDITITTQDNKSQNKYSNLRTRVALLKFSDTDPLSSSHPAKQAVGTKPLFNKNVHDQYDRRLLLLDFRLAALRYYVGMNAVDDLYYTKPQNLASKPISYSKRELETRIKRALISASNALKYGKKIDKLLECNWREEEVIKHRERIYEIRDYYLSNS